jgi:hypothetical protein
LEIKMSNYDELKLWLVSEGDVTSATPETEWDGDNSILVAATSSAAALEVAEAYDKGEVRADNLAWLGATIGCVCIRDDTGDYL